MLKVKSLYQPQTAIETFSEPEIKRLLNFYAGTDYLSVQNKTITVPLMDTGARCNGMIQMKPQDQHRTV